LLLRWRELYQQLLDDFLDSDDGDDDTGSQYGRVKSTKGDVVSNGKGESCIDWSSVK